LNLGDRIQVIDVRRLFRFPREIKPYVFGACQGFGDFTDLVQGALKIFLLNHEVVYGDQGFHDSGPEHVVPQILLLYFLSLPGIPALVKLDKQYGQYPNQEENPVMQQGEQALEARLKKREKDHPAQKKQDHAVNNRFEDLHPHDQKTEKNQIEVLVIGIIRPGFDGDEKIDQKERDHYDGQIKEEGNVLFTEFRKEKPKHRGNVENLIPWIGSIDENVIDMVIEKGRYEHGEC